MTHLESTADAGLGAQLKAGLLRAPAVLGRMSGRSWLWLGIYVALSGLLLAACALVVASREEALEQAVLDFLFPKDWHIPVKFLTSFAFSSQAREVMANVTLFLSLTLVSIVFFWAKELLSQWVERDMKAAGSVQADPAQWRDNAIWFEALEEIKWTLIGLALMCVTLWVGHDVAAWRQSLATFMSYGVLIFTTAVNFIAPPMQRRGMTYNQVLGACAARPVATLAFGAAMALPQTLLLSVLNGAKLEVGTTLVLLFSVNIVFVAWSAAAGTVLGVDMIPQALSKRPFGRLARALAGLVVMAVLGVFGWLGVKLGVALKDKTQILKCQYDFAWSEVEFEKPSLAGLLGGEVEVGVRLPMRVTNPSEWPVKVEPSRLALVDGGTTLAETTLSALEVPAGDTMETRLELRVKVRASSLIEGASLDPTEWGLVLYLDLDGLAFPVPLMTDR
jgi:hypothetical protein